jgi:hypothetical protein
MKGKVVRKERKIENKMQTNTRKVLDFKLIKKSKKCVFGKEINR